MKAEHAAASIARTGVPGLDEVIGGGFFQGHVFLIEGNPGTGKTTIALRFLLEGAAEGERGLYITLSETERELRASAASHGWSIGEQIEVFELVPAESLLDAGQQQSLLYSSDLELGETTAAKFAGHGPSTDRGALSSIAWFSLRFAPSSPRWSGILPTAGGAA
jgi:circadian clock protein KaiC